MSATLCGAAWAVNRLIGRYGSGAMGGAIPGTELNVHSHLARTSGGFGHPKPLLDYTVGITAKYKSLALDA